LKLLTPSEQKLENAKGQHRQKVDLNLGALLGAATNLVAKATIANPDPGIRVEQVVNSS
jgi:hypothetical protein